MPSKLRPTIQESSPGALAPSGATAYLMILKSVEQQPGLIHGALHGYVGTTYEHCAIGSFFAVNPHLALFTSLIDEVAMVNDSVPQYCPSQRRDYMIQWLKWKLTQLGMPPYRTVRKPTPSRKRQ